MKITVYTTTDCQFSKQEREYLASHNLQYEEKNLETNKDFLTEMLAVSNNFSGTPVTRVEKDDGTIAVLKGFTKEEFDTTFGFAAAATVAPEPPKVEEPKPTASTEVSSGVKAMEDKPAVKAEMPVTPPVETPPAKDEQLGSVLDKLEDKAAPPEPGPLSQDPAEENPVTPTDVAPAPSAPTIPNFPADAAPQTVK